MADYRKDYLTVMDDHFPNDMTISFGDQTLVYRKVSWKIEEDGTVVEKGLRYGENPGQEAALYELVNGNLVLGDCAFIEPGNGLVSALREDGMLQFGKHPGKTNLTDIDNALSILKYLMDKPAVAVMKHNNPSGVAQDETISKAYYRAYMADRLAAMGGCVAFNRPVDLESAEMVSKSYVEVVVAPEFEAGTVDILAQRKNLRIVQIRRIDRLAEYQAKRFVDFKSLGDGGIIVQQSPLNIIRSASDFKPAVATYKGTEYAIERQPTEDELEDMLFGWRVEQGVTSNSVLYVKDGATVGIGTGEQDRVGVAKIAIMKAYEKYADGLCFERHGVPYFQLELEIANGERDAAEKEAIDAETEQAHGGLIGAAMVSDAFFPFRDGVDVAIKEGVRAIVHPGGSLRDFESIQACNEASPQVTMVFTGQRAFKH
ncbi:MAG: IMP cyclohydrolase [Candidatus Hydrogenedentes bacterium]|nr:IMP cyclohydrolase [Candidatus Hydrogenedentota bacterium]